MRTSTKRVYCIVFGGGGHAKVVMDCMQASGIAIPYAILDPKPDLWGKEVLGVLVQGGEEKIDALKKEGVTHFVSGVGGVGDNGPRQRVFEMGIERGLIPLTLCHPSAVISPHSKIGRGTVVFARAVINPMVSIGDDCIINTGALIDHDCKIEDHVHIAPGAVLSGTVHVKRKAHIGTGASVRQEITIGEEAIVGAGSVVVNDIPPKVTVKGVPAR